jgi:probable rRNA maturation factor
VSGTLTLRNRHRTHRVDMRLLRRIVQRLVQDALPDKSFDLGVYLVAAPEMTRLNETFLQHQGSTDVITFNYTEPPDSESLHGEIFVCLDEAECQARRFRTTWQSELVRYVVHGVLHLLGYDDQQSRARLRMRAAENDLVRRLAHEFAFRDLRPAPEREPRPAHQKPTTIRAHEKHTRSTRDPHA